MRRFSRRSHRAGIAPGTLKTPHPAPADPVRITITDYAADRDVHEREVQHVRDCLTPLPAGATRWINVDGVHDAAQIEALGRHFGLHPLLLEDVVTVAQRSKVEAYGDVTYLVVRMLRMNEGSEQIESEQVSIVLTGDVLISFQERSGDVFEAVRERLRTGRRQIRAGGPPYLAYALIDAVVDHYFVLLERMGDQIERIEETLIERPTPQVLSSIHGLKRELIYLRKSVWPLREAINTMLRNEGLPFAGELHVYLRDLYDHTMHVIETIESYRDLNSGMLDIYLSSMNNRMNEIMKTLTVIATLFMPLTFITGIYGMNFEHMPELHLRWAYPALWLVILSIAGLMLLHFRRRRWI
jgi:magnesium transporter